MDIEFLVQTNPDVWTNEHTHPHTLNSLPNDKILDWSKLEASADNKIKVLKNNDFCL